MTVKLEIKTKFQKICPRPLVKLLWTGPTCMMHDLIGPKPICLALSFCQNSLGNLNAAQIQ